MFLTLMMLCGETLTPAVDSVFYAYAAETSVSNENTGDVVLPENPEGEGQDDFVLSASSQLTAQGTEATDDPVVTEAPTEAPTAEPVVTEVPTEAPTAEPVVTEVPTEAPTAEPVVTEVPTEAPTAEPVVTEVPTDVPTAEPVVTEVPTEAPTAEPVVTEVPTEAPTAEPVVTEVPTEAPTAEPVVTEAPTEAPTAEPVVTEEPTVVPTEEPTPAPTEVPVLDVSVSASAHYAVAGRDISYYNVTINSGCAPFAVSVLALLPDGTIAYEEKQDLAEAGSVSCAYSPAQWGDHSVTVRVTDGNGGVYEKTFTLIVAEITHETETNWKYTFKDVKLTGDWRQDVIAIARTQLGYRESEKNFILDETGTYRLGYTRYGEWYGADYSDWCAMFAAFCLHYAGIDRGDYPYDASCTLWRDSLQARGAWEGKPREYVPAKGDLVFFDLGRDGELDHMGIVTRVTEDKVYTIEGNYSNSVTENIYFLDDRIIVGYANTATLMKQAGIYEQYEQIDKTVDLSGQPTATPEVDQIDVTVSLTNQPTLAPADEQVNELVQLVPASEQPVLEPTPDATDIPAEVPTEAPTEEPTEVPTEEPTEVPTEVPTEEPTAAPTEVPAAEPTVTPEEPACECAADEAGVVEHAETCSQYVPDAETEQQEQVLEVQLGETITFEIPYDEQLEYQWQRSRLDAEGAWENITDDAIAMGWNTHALHVNVTEDSLQYQYRCLVRAVQEAIPSGFLRLVFGIAAAHAEEEWSVYPQTFAMSARDAQGTYGTIDISSYTQDLKIYNYLNYSSNAGEIWGISSGTIQIAGTAPSDVDVVIGDQANGEQNGTAPIAGKDIQVAWNAQLNEVTVKPVNAGTNQLLLNINGESSVQNLILESGAKMKITVDENLSIGTAVLADNATLTVEVKAGKTLSIATLNGGTVTLTGEAGGKVTVQTALNASDKLFIENVTVEGSGSAVQITAASEITVKNAKLQNMALFGFNADEGTCRLTFEGNNTLSKVSTVGAAESSKACVTIAGESTFSSISESWFVRDFAVTYAEEISTAIAPEEGWVVSYRAKSAANTSAQIIGFRACTAGAMGGYQAVNGGAVMLPVYSVDGYSFGNWKYNGNENAIDRLQNCSGDIQLIAVLEPYQVQVTMDLGYDPDKWSNDEGAVPERETVAEYSFGDLVALTKPVRFGYDFGGWRVKDKAETLYQNHYTIDNMDHLTRQSADEGYLLTLEAQWEKVVFPIYIQFPQDIMNQIANLHIALAENPGEDDWMTFNQFLADNSAIFTMNDQGTIVLTDIQQYGIRFEESFDAWFNRLGEAVGKEWHMPTMELRKDGAVATRFQSWAVSGKAVSGNHTMSNTGDYGVLHVPAGTSLETYQNNLLISPVVLMGNFGDNITLTVRGITDAWQVLLLEKGSVTPVALDVAPDANGDFSAPIPVGAKLYWRVAKTHAADFALGITPWSFLYANAFDVEITESPYNPLTDTYLEYVFTVPACDVEAVLDQEPKWIDLADSPITFVKQHDYNNLSRNGFWYNEKLSVLTPIYKAADGRYFYTWNFGNASGSSSPFYVTSNGVGTQNQLWLVDALDVHLKDCNMLFTDAFLADANGRYLGTLNVENFNTTTQTGDLSAYGNIVIDTSNVASYHTALRIHGNNNVIGTIFQDNVIDANNLHIKGMDTRNQLSLGTVVGPLTLVFVNLELSQIDENPFEYLVFITGKGGTTMQDCNVDARTKRIRNNSSSVEIIGSNVLLGSMHSYAGLEVMSYQNQRSIVRILGDLWGHYLTVNRVYANNALLVDGDLRFEWNHATAEAWIDGTVVVKGSRCDLGNLKMVSDGAFLLASMVTLSDICTVSAGTVITNQLMNTPDKPKQNSATAAVYNGDDAWLTTYAQEQDGHKTWNFTGGNVYLTGMMYNPTSPVRADDARNPLSGILAGLLYDSGALRYTAVSHETAYNAVLNAANSANQCFVLGDSRYTRDTTRSRTMLFGGSNIYAAGNITMFNDTNVTGGYIECVKGVLSSKHTLNISGGKIVADGVGNAYDILTDLGGGLYRYAKVNITGGTLEVDGIGAVAADIAGHPSRSVVYIAPEANISPKTEGAETEIVHTLYANYIVSESLFETPSIPDEIPREFIFRHKMSADIATMDGLMMMEDDAALAPPIDKATQQNANWTFEAVDGPEVSWIADDGYLNGDSDSEKGYVYMGRDKLDFYAVRLIYPVIVQGSYDGGFTVSSTGDDGEEPEFTLEKNGEHEATVGNRITIQLDDAERFNRTVVWYKDVAGVPTNVLAMPGANATIDAESKTISFTMPRMTLEVWITDTLTLDLYSHSVAFTKDGFRVAWDNTYPTSSFAYQGNLNVIQSNLEKEWSRFFVSDWRTNQQDAMKVIRYKNASNVYVDLTNEQMTQNYLRFEANPVGFTRNISIGMILQNGSGSETERNEVGLGVNAELTVDGLVQLVHTYVPKGSSIHIQGKKGTNGRTEDLSSSDVLYIYQTAGQGVNYSIGTLSGEAGDITLKDLRLLYPFRSPFVHAGSPSANAVFKMDNCTMINNREHIYSLFAKNIGNVQLTDTYLEYVAHIYTSEYINYGITNMTVKDTTIKQAVGSDEGDCRSFFNGVKNVVMDNSTYTLTWKPEYTRSSPNRFFMDYDQQPNSFVMKNGSAYNSTYRMVFKTLDVQDSTVRIEDDGSSTIMICPDLTVSGNSEVYADNIVVSGFLTLSALDKTNVLENLRQGKGLVTTGQMTVNGGSVTAEQFIGGDANARITINGGEMTAKYIGTFGLVYGIENRIPKNDEDKFTTFSIYESAVNADINNTITVAGGQVNVAADGYLGGVSAEVNVTAGQVNLAPGAVLGVPENLVNTYLTYQSKVDPVAVSITGTGKVEHTEDCNMSATPDDTKVNGSIAAPYGTVEISGEDVGVHVHNLTADHGGTITITGVGKEYYDNPYNGDDVAEKPEKVNVRVDKLLLSGSTLTIENAHVYAYSAYVNPGKGETADMIVSGNKEDTGLWIGRDYGKDPSSSGDCSIGALSKTNIHGTARKSIVYVLNEDKFAYPDNYEIINENDNTYIYDPDGEGAFTLADAQWRGRVFKGWYMDEALTEPVPKEGLPVNHANGYVVYADWEFDTVKFSVIAPSTLPAWENKPDVFAEERNGIEGFWNEEAQTFTFRHTVTLPYGSKDIVPNLKLETDFNFNSQCVSLVKYNEHDYTDVAVYEVLTGIYELYKAKQESGQLTKLSDDYAEATIELIVDQTALRRLFLTLDLNVNNGIPVNAAFIDAGKSGMTWTASIEIGQDISAAPGFVTGGELAQAAAPGYYFEGWYAADGLTKLEQDMKPQGSMTFYAKWEPMQFLVAFDALSGNTTTKDGSQPANNAAAVEKRYAIVTYDAPIGSMTYVTQNANGNWVAESEAVGTLPAAWKAGNAFTGWQWNNATAVSAETLYNIASMGTALPIAAPVTKTADGVWTAAGAPSITLTPVYQGVNYHFHANGGWFPVANYATDMDMLNVEDVHAEAFPGYTIGDTTSRTDVNVITGSQLKCSCGDMTVSILSTKVDESAEHDVRDGFEFASDDYRHDVQRLGYTFYGWYLTEADAAAAVARQSASKSYGAALRYPTSTDIHLYAAWNANRYQFVLYEPVKDHPTYNDYYDGYGWNRDDGKVGEKSVTVDTVIKYSTNPIVAWPAHEDMYALSKNSSDSNTDANRRYMLGFTFDPLDPGDAQKGSEGYSTYQDYAEVVNHIINADCLFYPGYAFRIPYVEYQNGYTDVLSAVPDYPNRTKIIGYAVYRERALVFIERYVDENDTVHEKVLHYGPINEYVDYPAQYAGNAELTKAGYSLTGWRMIFPESGEAFPDETTYYNKLDTYKSTATNNGDFDINVYTVYAAQAVLPYELNATSNPLINEVFALGKVPGSIKEGKVQYTVTLPEGFHLVDRTEMDANRFNPSWKHGTATYTANDTAAIHMELVDAAGTTRYAQWLTGESGTLSVDYAVTKDWQIKLTMYHSSVISQTKTYEDLLVKFTFLTVENQSLTVDATINLVPTLYDLTYVAKVPDNPVDVPLIIDEKDFAYASGDYTLTVEDVPYGSALPNAADVPSIEGFSWNAVWHYGDLAWENGTFTFPLSADNAGKVTLESDYLRNSYNLFSDEEAREEAQLVYLTNQDADIATVDDDQESILYRSMVYITGDAGRVYIQRGTGAAMHIDAWVENGFVSPDGDGYSFIMPAEDVTVSIIRDYTGEETLTACESTHAHGADEKHAYTFAFEAGKPAPRNKPLYLISVTPSSGLTLGSLSDMRDKQKTATSTYANSTFAFELFIDGESKGDVQDIAKTTALGSVTQDTQITLKLYNANAITVPGTAGTYTFVFATDPVRESADKIILTVTIVRIPCQLNVSVPLVLVVDTGIDGGTAEFDGSAYAISNDSSTRVQLMDLEIENLGIEYGGISMAYADADDDVSTLINSYRIKLDPDWEYHDLPAGDTYNPLESIEISPLSFVTKQDDSMGVQMANITYVLSIPESDSPGGAQGN